MEWQQQDSRRIHVVVGDADVLSKVTLEEIKVWAEQGAIYRWVVDYIAGDGAVRCLVVNTACAVVCDLQNTFKPALH